MALASTQIAMTAASTYSQYQASRAQGRYQEQIAETNARLAETQARDAIARGERAVHDVKLRTRSLIGRQRAALAAQGIEVNADSALDVQADTAGQGAIDEVTVRNNAWREAWGFKVQASSYRTQGKFARLSARNEARTTLLTGGLQAVNAGIGGFDRFQRNKGTKYQWV